MIHNTTLVTMAFLLVLSHATIAQEKNSNERTLESYQTHVQRYIEQTPGQVDGEFKDWIDRSLSLISKESLILELGSAFGRDAAYIQSHGFTVEPTDAVPCFVELLKSKGYNARILNILTDPISKKYDMVFANAVLLHFTREELDTILAKIRACLNTGGILSFSVKYGEGEGWEREKLDAPRYFCYWTTELLNSLLEKNGFCEIDIEQTSDLKWLQIIAKRSSDN
jgi:SAM-dependent methyltransferase